MKHIKRTHCLLAAAGLIGVSASLAQAQPYYVAGSGLNPSWAPGTAAYEMTGGPTVYSLRTAAAATVAGTVYADVEQFKVTGATWSNPNFPGDGNVVTLPDATGSNTFYFIPGPTADGWSPVLDRVGYADPGGLSFEIAGDFNGWGGGAGYQLAPIGNGVYSNSITIATAGTYGFKFRTPGSWNDIYFGQDFGNGGGNASITTSNSPQTLPFVLDLPNGRWVVGTPVVALVTNYVVFAVDMSSQLELGNFVPGVDTVYVSGSFNGWPGVAAGALVLTNVPTYNGNTNIYYATNLFIGQPGSTGPQYKFTCNDTAFSGNNDYEPAANNRTFNLLQTSGVDLLPVVSFGNVYASDYLTTDVTVTFTIDMTGAMTATNSGSALNSPAPYTAHAFDPVNDQIYINGNFLNGGWSGWDPISLSGTQMTNNPSLGSLVYQYTAVVPQGSELILAYKYGIGYASDPATNSFYDDEAAVNVNHARYIRITSTGSYNLPTDTFGNMYAEPSFGQLAIAPGSAGKVSLSWLGRPGVQVQTTGSLAGGTWVNHPETDGNNWTAAGSQSANGFVSTTNWPATGGNLFFRLSGQP
jgi:hypothetical protein